MSDVSAVDYQKNIQDIIDRSTEKLSERDTSGELGKDDFLKLLTTQLQYQNPLEPMNDTDFIAQVAQFTSLEQMKNMNQNFSSTMGFTMMGKYIDAVYVDEVTHETEYVYGKVDSVKMSEGDTYLIVEGKEVPLDKVTNVSDTPIGETTENLSDYTNLIGFLAKTDMLDNESGDSIPITGIVSAIEKKEDGVDAKLDMVNVTVQEIIQDSYDTLEEYLESKLDASIVVPAYDAELEKTVNIEGTLADYSVEEGMIKILLDDVYVPAENIISTEKTELLTTDQLLLNEILTTLKSNDSCEEESSEEGVVETGNVE